MFATLQIIKRRDGKYGVALGYESNGPYIRNLVVPGYPMQMRRMLEQGAVVVDAMVQPDGWVTNVHVLKEFTDWHGQGRLLAYAARRALESWKVEPLVIGGKAVPAHVRIPFVFEMGSASKARMNSLDRKIRKMLYPGGEGAGRPDRSGRAKRWRWAARS